jgi:hypothetical protein
VKLSPEIRTELELGLLGLALIALAFVVAYPIALGPRLKSSEKRQARYRVGTVRIMRLPSRQGGYTLATRHSPLTRS